MVVKLFYNDSVSGLKNASQLAIMVPRHLS